jgi:hypothetical protein
MQPEPGSRAHQPEAKPSADAAAVNLVSALRSPFLAPGVEDDGSVPGKQLDRWETEGGSWRQTDPDD